MFHNNPLCLLPILAVLSACAAGGSGTTFTPVGEDIVVTGVVDQASVGQFKQAMMNQPDAKRLILAYVPGSADDDANLVLSRMVRAAGLTTIVPADGMVASGGTDLLAAGARRIAEPGACIGVHSWAYGGLFGGEAGSDLPRDHEEHAKYEAFYDAINIPSEFYWFTLEAAPPEDIHWMRADEMNTYSISSTRLSSAWNVGNSEAECNSR